MDTADDAVVFDGSVAEALNHWHQWPDTSQTSLPKGKYNGGFPAFNRAQMNKAVRGRKELLNSTLQLADNVHLNGETVVQVDEVEKEP